MRVLSAAIVRGLWAAHLESELVWIGLDGKGITISLEDRLVVSPAGAALLARLEALHRHPSRNWRGQSQGYPDTDPVAVAAAVRAIPGMSTGTLLTEAVDSAQSIAGPWSAGAPAHLAAALKNAPARREIAGALVSRLIDQIHQPLDPDTQEWWWFNRSIDFFPDPGRPLGQPRRPSRAWVTATWDGLWTVSSPLPELADSLVDVWEMYPGPITRWHLSVRSRARIYEVDSPEDWKGLVATYPFGRQSRPNTCWEVPGPNQQPADTAPFADLSKNHAIRTAMNHFVEPDWDAVAQDWDGVHLTWAGFLTVEGYAIDLPDGDVAMLRNWCSERTLWLSPVLFDPRPLPGPPLTGRIDNIYGVDADGERRVQDQEWLEHRSVR